VRLGGSVSRECYGAALGGLALQAGAEDMYSGGRGDGCAESDERMWWVGACCG